MHGSEALLAHVLDWLDEAKAENVVTIDIKDKSSLGDYMVIASGRSDRHVGAVAEQIQRKLKEEGHGKARIEGQAHCDWVIDGHRRHHRPRVPARGARVLQPREDVVRRAAERSGDALT